MGSQDILNLASRRSLFYPSAEIYSDSLAGFWDFGPYGATIRRKIIDVWRQHFLQKEGFVEIYGAQILPEPVFKASGHLDNFNDPIVQCKKCHSFFRADKLIEEKTGENVPESLGVKELGDMIAKNKIGCKKCKAVDFDEVKTFNMMMKLDIGAHGSKPAYLRPETCQTIFLNFPRLYKTMRTPLPLGIAQAGASFRNEISPRNTLLRERELGQMEIEVFFNPDKIDEVERFDEVKDYPLNLLRLNKKVEAISCADAVKKKIVSGKLVAYYLARVQQHWERYGIQTKDMRFRELNEQEKAFYAQETWDFEVKSDLGWIELIACNYRTDYDLKGHGKQSKQDLSVNEEGKKFIPHVFEISAGIDRTLFVTLEHAFRKEKKGDDERSYLQLPPKIAPYFIAVYPLVKKDGLKEKAQEIADTLQNMQFDVFFDEKGSVGKRYARMDEIGVPFAITVDYDTMKDNSVTLRERDTMQQKRVKTEDLPKALWDHYMDC
jgi:glycyl-tRNA synthetase